MEIESLALGFLQRRLDNQERNEGIGGMYLCPSVR
jgi:hypothetical protein